MRRPRLRRETRVTTENALDADGDDEFDEDAENDDLEDGD